MPEFPEDRRSFLLRAALVAGASLLQGPILRLGRSFADPVTTRVTRVQSPVFELRLEHLRDERGGVYDVILRNFVLLAASVLTNERYPLDGLAQIFPDRPSVAVLVDARSG